jgi:hypothetical protein
MNNHSIKGTTLEICAYAFGCYPCFMIIDHETKENQSISLLLTIIFLDVVLYLFFCQLLQ